MLHQCTEPRADFRELIYRGTSRDCHTADASGPAYLRHLYRILIPPDVAELDQSRVLLIAPHGLLHALPFHALLGPDGPLVERAAISYVPSLAAFQALLQADSVTTRPCSRKLRISTNVKLSSASSTRDCEGAK